MVKSKPLMEKSNKIFNHIKIHTQYSICEGAIKIDELSKYCKDNKVRAVGMSDTSNLCGSLEFSEQISKSKTQPIIGSQIKFKFQDLIGSLPIIAKNSDGYKELINLSSRSFLENSNTDEPNCNIELLFNCSKLMLNLIDIYVILSNYCIFGLFYKFIEIYFGIINKRHCQNLQATVFYSVMLHLLSSKPNF